MIVGYAEWEDAQKDILDRVNNGETVSSLAREYGTTPGIMSLHVDKLRKRKKLLEENELYSSMYYSEIEVDAKTARRIVNCLNRVNVTTISDLQKLTIEELLNIRNLGASVVDIIEDLGWIEKSDKKLKYVSHCKSAAIVYSKLCKAGATKEELELYSNLLEKYNINRHANWTLVEKGERG